MKVQILEDKVPVKDFSEMNLFLEDRHDGVALNATDADHNRYAILHIYEDGIQLFRYIGSRTGWPLDKHGQIVVRNE